MRAVVLVAAVCVAAAAAVRTDAEVDKLFGRFRATHNRTYASPRELAARRAIFASNLAHIDQLNAQYNPRTRFGVNLFADLSREEFKKMYLTKPITRPTGVPVAPAVGADVLGALPDSFDWRPKGAVTAVKNQGQCGSCWSFSTTGNVEGQWFLAGHPLVGLSEQNLVDCDSVGGDAGCNGGLMSNAFQYIIQNGGIDTEASYPYTAQDGNCGFNSRTIGARIRNWTMLSQDESQIQAYLFQHGPVSVAADAEAWQFYIGGVFYPSELCGTSLDHGILLVGWGTETDIFGQTMPYWIVKNSWGASWGEDGYILLERGVGMCGINLFACSSIV